MPSTDNTVIDNPAIQYAGDIHVEGSRGHLQAGLDGNIHPETGEPTFWLDIHYLSSDQQETISWKKTGYRFSSVCCFCAVVTLGDEALNPQLLRSINSQCKMQYALASQTVH